MEKIIAFLKKNRELISYLFWGVMTTVVSWGSYALFVKLLSGPVRLEVRYAIAVANFLSWVCAVLFAFVTNKLWVFNSHSWKAETILPEFTKFIASRAATGLLEIVMVPLCVQLGLNQSIFGIKGGLSKIIISIVVVVLNYVLSKFMVFSSQNKKTL